MMTEELATYSESSLPGNYRYHLYNGFPGFCEHAAAAALALHRAFHHFDVDYWIDIVERFAAQAIAADVQHAAPSSRKALAGMAEDSRRYALNNGYATLRKHDNVQNHIADDASLCICANASAAFVVQFTSCADFRTTVYAQDAIEAEAVGQHLWDSHSQYSDAFDKIEDVT